MSRVIHFEIHASEPQRLIDFYTALFGWKVAQWGTMPYWTITTGAAGEPGIDGGLVQRRGPRPSEAPAVSSFVCTVQVDALDDALARCAALGGMQAVPKMPIPGVGWLAYASDPDGNLFGLMQPDPQAKA